MKIRHIFEYYGITPPSDANTFDNVIDTEFSDDPQLQQFGRAASEISDTKIVYFVIDGSVTTHGEWLDVKTYIVLNWFDLTSGTYQIIDEDGAVLQTITISR
jgi:hypothetical protein